VKLHPHPQTIAGSTGLAATQIEEAVVGTGHRAAAISELQAVPAAEIGAVALLPHLLDPVTAGVRKAIAFVRRDALVVDLPVDQTLQLVGEREGESVGNTEVDRASRRMGFRGGLLAGYIEPWLAIESLGCCCGRS
jgi:hypothetical protein